VCMDTYFKKRPYRRLFASSLTYNEVVSLGANSVLMTLAIIPPVLVTMLTSFSVSLPVFFSSTVPSTYPLPTFPKFSVSGVIFKRGCAWTSARASINMHTSMMVFILCMTRSAHSGYITLTETLRYSDSLNR
jgi:hypothetical protein